MTFGGKYLGKQHSFNRYKLDEYLLYVKYVKINYM